MRLDPAEAPARADLGFLRHRARPEASAPAADTADGKAAANPVADYLSGRAARPNRGGPTSTAPPVTPSDGASISFQRPGRRSGAATGAGSLDLSASTAPPAPPPSAGPAPWSGGSLYLSRPSAPPASSPTAPARPGAPLSFDRPGRGGGPATSGPLDLGADPPQRPSPARSADSLDLSTDARPARTPTAPAPRPSIRALNGERVRAGRHYLMSVRDPTVVLTRVQSGIGELRFEAAVSREVGDLRIGAAYQLRSGPTSIVQLAAGGNRYAPSSRRPVIVAGRDGEFEELGVDLRQVRDLERMAVYAFSESRTELTWGGTLVVTTSGGARAELPLESLYAGAVAVLMSVYNLDGELVVRAEMETIAGDVREAARAYGYDRITWRDGRNPVD